MVPHVCPSIVKAVVCILVKPRFVDEFKPFFEVWSKTDSGQEKASFRALWPPGL